MSGKEGLLTMANDGKGGNDILMLRYMKLVDIVTI